MTTRIRSTMVLFVFLAASCTGLPVRDTPAADPLPSWSDGSTKSAILAFVTDVTSEGGDGFVPAERRVATFDMDGTLIVEKPLPMVMYFALDALETAATTDASLTGQPWQAARDHDEAWLEAHPMQVLTETYKGLTQEQYIGKARDFMVSGRHPHYDRPCGEIFYAPMKELVAYLRANDFRVFVVSGSEQAFVRGAAASATGLPAAHLLGTQRKLEYVDLDFQRTDEYWGLGVAGPGKPLTIENHIGLKPIFAFGNTSGDQDMFAYTASNTEYRHMVLWLDHDDEAREFVYDGGVKGEAGWFKVSMKDDFERLFEER